MDSIEHYVRRWKPGESPIAIACGLIEVVDHVLNICKQHGVEFRDYTRNTDPRCLEELRDPDASWSDGKGGSKVAVVVFTQMI
eukprot:2396572-Prymnesium_polylepis.1